MGFNWRRVGRAIGTGGLSEIDRAAGSPVGGGVRQLDPGPNGNDMPAPGYERRSADQVQWDPVTGMPINTAGPPAHEVALQYQYRSQELIRQRQQALWGDAQNTMGQAAGLLSSYRPGGSAALGSGVYSSKAGLFANQAASLTEPDLMSAYREDQQIRAEREARRARNLQMGMSLLGLGAQVAGAVAGAPVAGAATPAVPGTQPVTAPTVPGATPGTAPATMAPPTPYGPQLPPGGVQQPPTYGMGLEPIGPFQAPGMETAAATMGGGGGAPGGAPGGGGKRGGGGGGGAGAPPAPGAGPMGGGGGYGQDGAFNGMSAGAAAMRANPMVERVALQEIVNDPTYQISTTMRMTAARRRLMEAMA